MELFDVNELRAAETLRLIDAAQVPGQMTVADCLADVAAEQAATVEDAPVFAVPAGELFALAEVERGQLVLA